ncbi:alpha/beta fold hydrolase [Haloferax namakaokahaiae]|uniref:Alpha/beta fold hydrolase n=1 Tax=Haloferax namakaokahaiae TaxID=1748331 RepID=A0ABD5ZA82_9EURY
MPSVQTADTTTYYVEAGSGHPIVFVHGAILDHRQWDVQRHALADDYRTLAYDVRGHGRTGRSVRRRYSIDTFVADLDAFITGLDLDRPVLCGLSMGGCIAQAYAATYPDRISGLVLVDTFTPELFDRREWFQRSLLLRATILPVRLVGYERVEKVMVWLQERIEGRRAGGDYENVEALRRDGPKMDTEEFAKVIRALASFHEVPISLSAITVPTLVLYGEHELAFVKRHAEKLGRELPDVVVQEVPDAGHASNLDNPEFVTAQLRHFVAERVAENSTVDGTRPREM